MLMRCCKGAKLAAWLLALVLSLGIACALGISPAKTDLDFQANQEAGIKLRIINNEHRNIQLVVYAKGDLADYVHFKENVVRLSENESEKVIYVSVAFPASIEKPGTHDTDIIVLELPKSFAEEGVITQDSSVMLASQKSDTLLTATTAVISKLYIRVPYPGTYLESRIYVSEADVGQPVIFSFPVYNFGKDTLENIKAVIEIYTPLNERVDRIETEAIKLDAQKEGQLSAEWRASVAGEYLAVATIYYADKKLELRKSFNVGNLYVSIEKIDVLDFSLGQIAKFNIYVENRWNKPASNVYGEVQIFDLQGKEYTSFKTASVDIQPKVVEKIVAYWDTTGVSVGPYDMKILLHYADKVTEKLMRIQVNLDSIQTESPVTAQAIAKESALRKDSMLLLIIALLVMVNVAWLIYIIRSRKRKNAP
jgi:hypothetical protein